MISDFVQPNIILKLRKGNKKSIVSIGHFKNAPSAVRGGGYTRDFTIANI